jgi:Bifunctional DNA primase/polymerase, N-terminal
MKLSVNKTKLVNGVSASVGLGFAVIPVIEGDKKPKIPGWPKFATKNLIRAKEYFANHSNLNYGNVTGGASRIFVIDVDGIEGKVPLAVQEAFHGKLPRTVKVKSPHGEHYYFTPRFSLALVVEVAELSSKVDGRRARPIAWRDYWQSFGGVNQPAARRSSDAFKPCQREYCFEQN